MPFRIHVSPTIKDSRAEVYLKNFQGLNAGKINSVSLVNCYTVDAALNPKQKQKALRLLTNPSIESSNTNIIPPGKFDWLIEIGFLPGVTDNAGTTARESLLDGIPYKFQHGESVYSSLVFFVSGHIDNINTIANSLYNPLIQRATILSAQDFKKNGLPLIVPKVELTGSAKVQHVDLNVSDEELVKLGKLGIPAAVISEFSSASDRISGIQPKQRPGSRLSDAFGRDDKDKRNGPLALDLATLKTIREYFNKLGRKPTDVELEMLAQTWSEHCKHLIFASPINELEKGLYKTYIKAATEKIRQEKKSQDFCVSVFTDNAGGIIFDDEYLVTHKVETHNTPSALDPFGGAITGLVGVNRDALGFGLGAKPIANFYGFCLAEPRDKTELYRDAAKKNKMLSAERIMQGVVAGINSGGNQSGIPTPLGFLYFDTRFRGKPLVFAGTVGLIPRKIGKKLSHQKKAQPGDYIVMIGGRVGKDGIHGATFSSEGLDTHSPATAVQIGDPITQKKFSDALVREARDAGLYNSITDNGAGGLSSSVGEMAEQSGGCEVWIDKVPVKYAGLKPWEIWISESQERMTLAVPKKNWAKFSELMKRRDIEATIIGEFTDSGKCVGKYGKEIVMNIDLDFLHHGLKLKHLHTAPSADAATPRGTPNFAAKLGDPDRLILGGEGPNSPPSKGGVPRASSDVALAKLEAGGGGMEKKLTNQDLKSQILNLLQQPNITSYEFISKQYDHEVQGTSVTKPLQGKGRVNAEAAVLRPVLDSKRGIVLSSALYPELSELNPYAMAATSIDSAIRAAVAAGANVDYLALLDNFCWCSPEDPTRLWQLKEAARACYDTAVAFGTPFISGKDSMYNDFKGFDKSGNPVKISILPTLLISAIGVIPDVEKVLTIDVKAEGDVVYVVQARGLPNDTSMNPKQNLSLYRSFYRGVQKNLIASAISISHGGLAAALSKMCIAGTMGVRIDIAVVPCSVPIYGLQPDQKTPADKSARYTDPLFSESPGRLLVTIDPKKQKQFEKIMSGNIFAEIGRVGGKNIVIDSGKKNLATISVLEAEKAYKSTFRLY